LHVNIERQVAFAQIRSRDRRSAHFPVSR